jgi:hypothetical protein
MNKLVNNKKNTCRSDALHFIKFEKKFASTRVYTVIISRYESPPNVC